MIDVVVTGLPRSGATLFCALLDSLPDAVCLNEPKRHVYNSALLTKHLPFCKWLIGDYAWTRLQFLRQEPVHDLRGSDGKAFLDGRFDPRITVASTGKSQEDVLFTRPGLTPDFILGMKHTTLFTAILPQLVQFGRHTIVAVIRHPLDVLASWDRLNELPIVAGRLPDEYWPQTNSILASNIAYEEKMVQLYDAYLQRYHELREHITIIRYEELVHNPLLVSRLVGSKDQPPAASQILVKPRVLLAKQAEKWDAALKKYGLFARHYYPDIQ